MNAAADLIAPLRDFVIAMTRLIERCSDEATLLEQGTGLLAGLLANDTWLPDHCAAANVECYQQYLLHCDPLERFSVVSFVWGPGQTTPIHDHTVWGLIGVLRGAEVSRRYTRDAAANLVAGAESRLEPGQIEAVSPRLGDVHAVANAYADRPSISIHVYGANIGAVRRHAFDATTAESRVFVSGYSSTQVPNLWSRAPA